MAKITKGACFLWKTALKHVGFCDKLNVSARTCIGEKAIEKNSIDIRWLAPDDYVCMGGWNYLPNPGTG